MQVGERIRFPFGGEEKEGIVEKIFPKKVYLRVDFPGHPGKRIIRPLALLEGKISPPAKKKKKSKEEKRREKKSELKAEGMKENPQG